MVAGSLLNNQSIICNTINNEHGGACADLKQPLLLDTDVCREKNQIKVNPLTEAKYEYIKLPNLSAKSKKSHISRKKGNKISVINYFFGYRLISIKS